jgi:hypothetical protein
MNSAKDTAKQVRGGLPHSETPGSPIARISPGLFAACCVLHRLSVPRHPPDALLFARSQDAAHSATLRVSNPVGPPRRTTSRNPPRTGTSPSSPIQRSFTQKRVYPITRAPHRPPPARRSMKTLLRTTSRRRPRSHPRTHGLGQQSGAAGISRHPPRSHSPIRFTPSINTAPETAPASTVPENPVFSECLFQITEIRSQTSDPLSTDPLSTDPLSTDPLSTSVVRSLFSVVWSSGGERDRTDDLLLAKQALSQLSYTPQATDHRSEATDRRPQITAQRPQIRLLSDLRSVAADLWPPVASGDGGPGRI